MGNDRKKAYEVYGKIEINRLEQDEDYTQAVLDELLSRDNIELSNAGGYIGEIISSNKLRPGQEEYDEENGFYTYQVSESNALCVDSNAVTATMMWEKRQKTKNIQDEGR